MINFIYCYYIDNIDEGRGVWYNSQGDNVNKEIIRNFSGNLFLPFW